jgi:hypothetical protein
MTQRQAKKERVPIPNALKARVLFTSDRTCCVCRVKGKPTQIHHVNENPADNDFSNLAVLCFDCHTETQIRGGFHNKLDSDQVALYREHWLGQVAKTRAIFVGRMSGTEEAKQGMELELATSIADIYRERAEYELLALHYLSIGNASLRDKYIELAVQQGMDDDSLIFFRSEQGCLELVPQEIKARRMEQLKKRHDWFGLGRLHRQFGEDQFAASATCKGVVRALGRGEVFSAAFYLKEMIEQGVIDDLFTLALRKSEEENDLWWQFRSMQELGWDSEARDLLLNPSMLLVQS